MKILKYVIEQQHPKVDQVLPWLYWLKMNCFGKNCEDCFYWKPAGGKMVCEVHATHDKAFPGKKYTFPAVWIFKTIPENSVRPPDLDFLCKIRWDSNGFPRV